MPDPVKCFLEINKDMKQLLLVILIFLRLNITPKIEYLLNRAATLHEACLLFSDDFFSLMFGPLKNHTQEDRAWMADQPECAVVVANFKITFLGESNNKRFCVTFRPINISPDLVTNIQKGCSYMFTAGR